MVRTNIVLCCVSFSVFTGVLPFPCVSFCTCLFLCCLSVSAGVGVAPSTADSTHLIFSQQSSHPVNSPAFPHRTYLQVCFLVTLFSFVLQDHCLLPVCSLPATLTSIRLSHSIFPTTNTSQVSPSHGPASSPSSIPVHNKVFASHQNPV